jgi:hypothetical protein
MQETLPDASAPSKAVSDLATRFTVEVMKRSMLGASVRGLRPGSPVILQSKQAHS